LHCSRVDPTGFFFAQTGKIGTSIVSWQNYSSAGSITLDESTNSILCPMNVVGKKEHPFFVSIELRSKTFTQTQINDPTDSFIRAMDVLN
jgi:hypothetical protein